VRELQVVPSVPRGLIAFRPPWQRHGLPNPASLQIFQASYGFPRLAATGLEAGIWYQAKAGTDHA